MKNFLKLILQRTLGFENYLFLFSIFKILTLKYDKKESEFLNLLPLLPKNAIILDVGTNIGIMTVLLARRCSGGKVYAYEPINENFETLKKIIRFFRLKNIVCNKIALGNKNGMYRMIMPIKDSVKLQGLSHIASYNENNRGIEYEVELKKLDDLFVDNNERITAIKIDVENYENFVFRGALNLIKKNKPIIYAELWNNDNRENSFNILKGLGYSVRIFDGNVFQLFEPGIHKTQNFFFFPSQNC